MLAWVDLLPADMRMMSEDGLSREQLLEDLREMRRKYDELLYELPEALFELDITGEPHLSYMNRMAIDLCGYTEEDLERGIPVEDFFANKVEYQRALQLIREYVGGSPEERTAHRRTARPGLHEFRARRKDGTEFCAESQMSHVLDDQGLPVRFRTLIRDITERVESEREMECLIEDLQDALAHVKTLKGLLPICASCKKVRDDDGYWSRLEVYIGEHADVEFSHSICPDCMKAMYPV